MWPWPEAAKGSCLAVRKLLVEIGGGFLACDWASHLTNSSPHNTNRESRDELGSHTMLPMTGSPLSVAHGWHVQQWQLQHNCRTDNGSIGANFAPTKP